MRIVFLLITCCCLNIARAADKPNIVVFYTDDHGYADLSCQGVFDDIRTPNVDALAAGGVRALHGYSTAPQCVPSRAGLLVGKFQAKFGVESNGKSLEGFDREITFAERLQDVGYVTAQFGKWHLGPGSQITQHGFEHVYNQNSQGQFHANMTLAGEDIPMGVQKPEMYHVDACSVAASSIIKRYHDQPLCLYVAYRAPHVPLDAPPKYLNRFPGEMPERRRQALAMLSAVDDGVGLVMKTLKDHGLTENTLVFYIGDNGAPLKITKADAPGGGPGWDGSLNDPLNGEKGMLSEGGMHTPFVVSWPVRILAGQEYEHPISALDVAATATAVAAIETKSEDLDGVNLIPFLSGENKAAPHDALMWRWISQSAIREGNWKLLRGGDREYLYDLKSDLEEKHNLAEKHPEVANRLREKLDVWSQELDPPGLATGKMASTWDDYFDFYLDGKPLEQIRPSVGPKPTMKGLWIIRNGKLKTTNAGFVAAANAKGKNPTAFLVRNGLNLQGPVKASITLKTSKDGPVGFAWRHSGEKDFAPTNRVTVSHQASVEWSTVNLTLPTTQKIIHLRVHIPGGTTEIQGITLTPATGKKATINE